VFSGAQFSIEWEPWIFGPTLAGFTCSAQLAHADHHQQVRVPHSFYSGVMVILSQCHSHGMMHATIIRRAVGCLVCHVSYASQKRLSRLRRWSVELGSLAALQLLIACCSLCVLLLYMRLGPDKQKFVWNRIGQFSACVTANLVLGATATLASMNNQIW